ncbi:helix-turn-helix domain-containing protein [Flavobacterium rakeshii]|uniref:Helix-turn-helix domain-containing protein n=1 Tax=Flavobacterium rakeshii TaxID=1038845 RepID=A0A6N8HG02_9FLAO|nr:AraC family transcriptional regulator [Flavobacterium rakeshii]MUV04659.1 helix-turn-helix domain-containing protein [Flavobacterium rakeshii]
MKEKEVLHFSCHYTRFRDGEHFTPDTVLGMVITGSMELFDSKKRLHFKAGDLYLAHRNQLLKYVKYPPDQGEFRSVSLSFEEDCIRAIAKEINFQDQNSYEKQACIEIPKYKPLLAFFQSLNEYEAILNTNTPLLKLKQKEALLLLLECQPSLEKQLFDFNAPNRISLEAFMEKSFHFNVNLERLAYLSGRSLSTFKRDFEQIYHQTPSRWLMQRRLNEAYYLIKEKGESASTVYLEVGFENLSHFSFAFKKCFGINASSINPE